MLSKQFQVTQNNLNKFIQFSYKKNIFDKYQQAEIVRKKGADLLRDPFFNKGVAFPYTERDRLNLRGLLPYTMLSIQQQSERDIQEFYMGWVERAASNPNDEIIKSGVSPDNIRKWRFLDSLQNRNIHQFYQVLQQNFEDMAPIIYTPTVGWVCQNYSALYKRSRGMFFSKYDKGEMNSMIYNWESDEIDAIVVTDGSRVLGLGDLGVGGMGISVGKLDLYIAAAGFNPHRVLPVVMDIGTNNKTLINDPFYIGVKEPRIDEKEYYPLIDEFMAAVLKRWPKALVQFEDFDFQHALPILKRYRDDYLVFNDDIQGTAATALSGLYGALKVQGLPYEALKDQRIIVVGAGSAGGGVIKAISYAMHQYGLTYEESSSRFWVLDKNGLISNKRVGLQSRIQPFARKEKELEGLTLLQTIREVKPTILIGLSGIGRVFTEEILTEFNNLCQDTRPIIFPLSNPTSRSECSAQLAAKCSKGRAIFASGSPFEDVIYQGKLIKSSQCNNRYIFPGLAKGAWLGQIGKIDNKELLAAALAVAELISEEEIQNSCVFPQLANIRDISTHLAARVIEVADKQGKLKNKEAKQALDEGLDNLKLYIKDKMWNPNYKPYVYLPIGMRE